MTESEKREIVRTCLVEAGIDPDCVDYWEVWNFSGLKIQLDGDFSMAEMRAFCNALERIESANKQAGLHDGE